MNDHESIRKLLSLAAGELLDLPAAQQVEQHIVTCDSCREEFERWKSYTGALRQLPQPPIPPGLLQRTQARILAERSATAARREHALVLAAVAIVGWSASWMFWLLLRSLTGGTWNALGANLLDGVTWFWSSTAVTWMTAATAALALGRRHELRRAS